MSKGSLYSDEDTPTSHTNDKIIKGLYSRGNAKMGYSKGHLSSEQNLARKIRTGNLGAQFKDHVPLEHGPHWSDADPNAYLQRNIGRALELPGDEPESIRRTVGKGPPAM